MKTLTIFPKTQHDVYTMKLKKNDPEYFRNALRELCIDIIIYKTRSYYYVFMYSLAHKLKKLSAFLLC